jgi:hypothetical protein
MRGRESRLVTVTVTVLIGLTSPDCRGARRHRAYHDGLHPRLANANVAGRALARELASSGGVTDRLDQEAGVAVVDTGDGLAELDGRPVGEACGEAEHSAFPGRAGKIAGLQDVDGGFPVDRRRGG